ncbi:MAG: hypothetical protein PHX56_08320 [Atribacterota bacterium]|nr:hypothetical protein [Atribacterota bacterium]
MGYNLEGGFPLSQQYINEQLLLNNDTNRPTKTVSFDGGIYSVGNDVVNGQVSDVAVKGQTSLYPTAHL